MVLRYITARIRWIGRRLVRMAEPLPVVPDPPILCDRDLRLEDIPNVDSPEALWRFARSCEERDDTTAVPGRLAAWTYANYLDTGTLPSDLSTLRISLMHACSGPVRARMLGFQAHFDHDYVEVILEHIVLAARKRDRGDESWLTTVDVCTRMLNAGEAFFRRRGTTYEQATAELIAEYAERGIRIPELYLPSRACKEHRTRTGSPASGPHLITVMNGWRGDGHRVRSR